MEQFPEIGQRYLIIEEFHIMYKYFLKRVIDFILALCALAILWPVLFLVTLWLHFANKGAGAFFLQERSGKDGKIFKIIKFKTMTDERDEGGKLLSDDRRLTKVGRFLRITSTDELPQLINVLKGDMSLIGPRPLLPEYTSLYDPQQAKRLNVRPGITGWAQIHGRNSLKLSERFKMDVWYVEHLSCLCDIIILYNTIYNLFVTKVVACRQDLVGVDDLDFDKRAFGENSK